MTSAAAISVRNLGRKYAGPTLWSAPHWALRDVSLDIEQGEAFGLIGQNGAGKSTLQRILCGLLAPSRGRAAVGGLDPRLARARLRLGYLPESPLYYPDLTVEELLLHQARLFRVPLELEEARVKDAISALGLERRRRTRTAHCSKGTLQRLAIAAVLVPEPDIYIMDEPFSGLDPSVRHRLNALLEMLTAAGCTILLCAHELPEIARHCHRVGVLHEGRLAAVVDRQRFGGSAEALESMYLDLVGKQIS